MERLASYQPHETHDAIWLQHCKRGSAVMVFPRGPGHEKPFLGIINAIVFHVGVNNVTVKVEVVEEHKGGPKKIRSLGGGTSAVLFSVI